MNFKKSVFRCFVSVMLLFSLIFGLTVPAFATGLAPEKSTQYIQYNSATKELIEKTISELSAKGKVYKPKTDKALGLKVKQISGLSLGAVKTSILFDLFSNYEDGRIDTARFGLDAVTIEKVLNMTLKEFALDSAVDIVEIKTDDNGIAIGIEFEMRSSFKSGLDEFSSVSKGEPGAVDDTAPTVDNTVRDGKGGTETAAVTVTETEVNAASGWTAEFNWSYRYVGDPTNQVGLVFRGGEIQAASTDENGYFLTKIEFYLESITLTPLQPDGNPVPDTEPVILPASEGTVSTVGNKTTITYPNGLKVEDLFVDNAYLGGLQAELNTELENNGGVPNEKALQLIDQLNALGPCIFSHVLTASFTDPVNYPSYDETLADVYKETINATELAVYQYYTELCDFNGAFPQHFGSAANFWTSKDTSSGGTPILGALKTLCNMQPDTFVPFGAYDADQNGELDMQTEIGLDFLISMLTQAFMAYEQQLGPLLDAKIYDCAQQINENMTTEQKMLAIHDWLANNAEFDIGIITAMKDGTSGGSDPSQMTAFGTLLYEPLGIEGAICLGYAATYYLLLQQVMGLKTDVNDIVMVRWWADIAETSVAGPDSGFGQGRFNETHYFNAVKLGEEWYYIDACYDDIHCEVMTQYRVETDGNISHNYFLFAPTSALNMFDGNVDYVDSAYDGVTFQRRLDLDDQGQVQYKNMSPVYETDTDEAGNEHVIWYHSDYPEAAQDADDATNAYLDSSIECSETAYDDTQYEKSWFTAAMGEIHCDGTYYYYVAGELNSYAAMSGNDFDNGQGGDYDIDVNLGEIFNNDDPSFADRLVRRKMTAPVNATQDSANESNWARQVEIEFSMNGGEPMTAERDVFVDPYTETIFHYGFGTLGQPRLDSDKTTPILGEDGNYINDKTEVPLLAEYADIVAYDAEFMEIYPDLAHTSGVYDGKLYFNVANQIYSLSIADIADWDYTIALLKEYNTVSYFSDGLDFGNENGSRFTGKTFHLTSDQAKAIGTMTGKPIAAISLEDRWEVTGEGIIHHPTLTVSIGTNLSESTKDSNEKSYRVEAVNYNPNYITGYSDEDENSNVEFMWCANLVEDLLMSNIEADLAAGADSAVEVTVAPFCLTDGFTERRGSITGVSIPGTRVVDEGTALGHDYAWNDAQSQYICNRCGAVSGETSAQQTIIYDSNTGSGTMADTTGDTGASVTLSENTFTKAGYTFTGWNTAADGSGTAYADKASITMPAGGLTLYAQWDAAQQTITYDSNTGSGTMADTTGDTDSSVTLSENTFIKADYTFTGWNTAADGSGTGYADKASITMPAGGLTLYAQWTAAQQTITYDSNTGSGTMADTTGDTGASVTLRENTFTKAGYTFTGWNTAADGSGTSYADKASITMPAGGLTLYAQWDAAQQTITYDSNTGSGTMADTTGDTGASVTLRENTFTKAGYTFTGWNTAADGSGTGYADKASITMPAGGLTLYAQWTAAQQTITYDSNTGSGTMADTTGDTGASVTLRENTFTKAGYTFTGWNTAADGSGTGYADKASITMPTGGLTLYAQWTAAQQTITYDSNTGSGTMADTTGDTDSSVTLSENTFIKADYTFTGWNTAADGSGTGYADKASITMPAGGLTLYAQWTAAQQTITYDSNTGSGTMADTTGDTGASVTLRENTFTKAGYTFTGWNTAADGSGTGYADKASITMPAGGLTLYAQWTAAQQTITYDSNTGSGTMADTTGDTGASVTLRENTFTKAGYTFTGWNTAADGSGTGYADKASITMPAGGLTLYAQWTAAQQTITYDSNTGSGTMADTTGDTGASVTLRENTFTKAGYTFTGWNTAADGSGTGYADKASITMPAGGLTLYAQWDAAQQTITYDSNTGSGTMADTTGDTGASVTLRENTFTKAGYTFTGWNTAADGSGTGYADKASITMPAGGLTLYAQWTAAQQTITYDSNTGSGTMADTTGDTDSSVTLSENTFIKADYTFTGWNTAADGSGTGYADKASITMPAGGLTLYAQWTAAQQTITYDSNTGSGTMADTTGDTGASVTLRENTFTKAGYTFTGWNTAADGSGTGYADKASITMPAGGLTLYAQWTAAQQTITYDSNTGSGTMADTTGDTGASVTLRENTFTKAGYTFTGWNTAADGSGTGYADKASITMPTGGLTLYAQWTAAQQTITYDSNTGSGTMADTTGDTGASVTLRENTFTKAGYTFTGWNTAADGSGTGYADKASITMPTGGLTLYAQWTAAQQTITYDSNTGSGTMADTTGDTGASVTLRENTFTKAGYTFTGWNTAADGSGTGYADKASITMPTGGLTLYAQWDAAQQTITYEVIAGANRYDTAALISKRLNDSADTVILTTGKDFPDALSAGPLAVQVNASILLCEVNKIPTETMAEINRLGASKVIILGGLKVIASSVETTLKNQGISVERISGDNRFLTAIETAKKVRASSGQLEKAILVNGYDFADALSIGSDAAKAERSILLTSPKSLSPETKQALVEFGIKEIEIIGGEQAVSKAVEDELAVMGISVSRISGSNRFATSAAVAGQYFADSQNAIISTGRGFADALAAVPLAVKQDAPILLVEKNSLPTEISSYLGGSIINNISIVGGELAVSSAVRNQILDILQK